MAEALVLKAERREKMGTREARRLRSRGKVPVIIYGHKQEPVSAALSHHDLTMEIKHHHRLLGVELDGKMERFLVKDIQYDYLGDTIIHVDLTRVNLDERVQVMVEVVLKGVPEGVHEGGVLAQPLTSVELECPVVSIPEEIRANIGHLKAGETLTAGDLELPDGASLITEANTPVATVRIKEEEAEEETVEEAETTDSAEPERIGREKTEEEEPKS
ncbi:MAG: 50S ribosomal protein L25 [Sedimentisphaerales bacterium]|nr:50S ribosomal protein L25 [Sedimentisphaerales bacterium]